MSPTDLRPLLETLRPDQEALLPAVRDEWLRIGLATGPADRPAAERGVRQAYQAAGLPRPSRMVWLGSPLAGAIAASMLSISDLTDHVPSRYWLAVRKRLRDQLRASVWTQPSLGFSRASEALAADRFGAPVGRQVQNRIAERTRHRLIFAFHDSLGRPARETLRQVVEDPIRGRVSVELGDRLDELIRGAIEPEMLPFPEPVPLDDRDVPDWDLDLDLDGDLAQPPSGAVRGQHDAHWLALDTALRSIAPGALAHGVLGGLAQAARAAGWWWPFEHLVVLTERPTSVRHDPQGRLHCADGPAITYPDGLSIWAWHGVSVPRHVIEQPLRLTVRHIRSEPNVAVRQVMLERYGLERYLHEACAAQLSHDDTGTLWRADLVGREHLSMVQVRNSTPEPDGTHKTYWLRVPPTIHTAREAVAWTFGLTAERYQPIIET